MGQSPMPWSRWYRPYRAFGRFPTMRRAYSWLAARLTAPRSAQAAHQPETLFPDLSPQASTCSLRHRGVHAGLRLPPQMVAAIVSFAESAPCTRPSLDESFRHAEVRHGMLADGRPVPVADLCRPMDCAAVTALRGDAGLLSAAHDFLGYRPGQARVRLFWSFAATLSDETRRACGQTIDFHYDVPWFNGLYAYFYLTPSDRHSGAHVTYVGSARDKPLRFVLASAFRDEAALAAYYGAGRQMVIEGPAGFGFFEDPFGFHKALPPVERDRLVLQLRYC